jgi:pyridoxal phosphate enzyme (YggS family)
MDYEEFKRRTDAVRARIAEACASCGRSPGEVELLAVTKSHPVEAAVFAARYGLRAVGENRVQEAVEKRSNASPNVAWELIGHLQSNKARVAVQNFDRIQSVDSMKLLDALDRAASQCGKTVAVLLQVNAGMDPAKSGVDPDGAQALLGAALERRNLRVEGLMTIAPLSGDAAVARRTFALLREIRDRIAAGSGVALRELSMGMSGDMEAAIAEGRADKADSNFGRGNGNTAGI